MGIRTLRIGLICMTFFAALGCSGESVGLVQGVVTLDDKPLGGAGVNFVLKDGNVVAATTDSTGNYQIEVPTGDCKIGLSAREGGDDGTGESAKKMLKGAPPPAPKSKVPQRYCDPETSGFKLNVTTGVNNYPIAMKSK